MNTFQPQYAQSLAPDTSYIKLSQLFLYAIRSGDSSDEHFQRLGSIDRSALKNQLSTDDKRKAFWLNIYNAFVQKLLTEQPEKYQSRNAFFSARQINIAGTFISLDDIEHGILRRSNIKWGMGYLTKLFPPAFEKDFRVARLDNRIHFALNCGAKSCPPIAFYDPAKIDKQLELATRGYLSGEVEFDKTAGIVHLPAIMSWYRGDFGGKKGIKELLENYHLIDKGRNIRTRFKKYDWALFLKNYKETAE